MIDNWLDKQTYLRITDTGPESLPEAMWYYLYTQGIKGVPFSWEWSRFVRDVGKPFVSITRKIIQSIT